MNRMKVNRKELFKRTEALLRPETARKETWAIIGVGSGGARVAEEATRFGIGTIILVDRPDERLEEHNIIRHPLGYRDIGRRKADALADHLRNINPDAAIESIPIDVVNDRDCLATVVRRSTQVHLCTDNERSKHVVNEEAVKANATLIFAGVFDGGCGGEVGRMIDGGACYGCMAAYLNRSTDFDDQHPAAENFDYSNPDGPEKSTAALNLDIAQIALIQARVGLLTMLGKFDKSADFRGNYVLFGNRVVEGLFPRMLFSEIWEIPRDPGCLVCSAMNMTDAELDAAAERILANALCHTD